MNIIELERRIEIIEEKIFNLIIDNYIKELKIKGYVIIPNILTISEIDKAKELFYKWKNTIPNHDKIHPEINPHGIYKFHQAGHQEHAWYLRTRKKIIKVFKQIWNTEELVTSFDGSCYISSDCNKKDKIWTHTDQAPNSKGLKCYQSFVSLTKNKERTLIVYEGSHNLHEEYFKLNNINSNKNWQLIDHDYLEKIKDTKKILNVNPGDLVIWDSRTFHQNQYGNSNSEERIVQYLCYLPKNNYLNTNNQKNKRLKYFHELRTTSHWPYPINVNGLQPQTYGDKNKLIDYSLLTKPNLIEYNEIILNLI